MAQKFLSINNFEKYQNFTKKNPPWFKIHRCMFGDPEFMKLSTHHRFLYIGLIHLAVETNNKVYNDRTWIGQRLYIPCTEVDLTPLYRCGFLATSNLRRTLSETETEERQRQRRDRPETNESAHAARSQPVSDDEWMTSLRENAGYAGIDIALQRGRCEAWCHTNGKTFSRRRFINWLNRTDKPMNKPDWKEAFLRDEA